MKLPKIVIEKEKIFQLIFIIIIGFSFLFSMVIHLQSDLAGKDFLISFLRLFLFILYNISLFLGFAFILTVIIYILFTKGIDEILDNCVLPLLRKYKKFLILMIYITFFIFVELVLVLFFSLNVDQPQDFIFLVKKNILVLFFLFVALFSEILLLAILNITKPPKLSSSLAKIITPEDLIKDPTSAISKSFGYFESELRKKLNEHNEKVNIRALIHTAFNEDKGRFVDPRVQTTSHKDRWRGMVELMTGMYSHYRNPLAHGQLDFNKSNDREMVKVILILLDKSIQLIDEIEEEQ